MHEHKLRMIFLGNGNLRLIAQNYQIFDSVDSCTLANGIFAFIAIWCSQPDADPMLINFEPQTAVFIDLDHLEEVGVGGGVGSQTLF